MHIHPAYLLIALAAASMSANAERWAPAAGPLTTPWTGNVTPEQAWPDYPRPQLVRPDWTNLNGLWQFAIVERNAPQPSDWDGEILVPFAVESVLSGVRRALAPDQALWYRRSLSIGDAHSGRWLLHFGAVDWDCTVWVNGHELGRHIGGYDPFSFDVTAQLRPGNNELVVKVLDPTDQGYQPRGKQVLKPHGIMYTAVSGIWQTVWLEPVPERYIRGLRITPNPDRQSVSVVVDAPAGLPVRASARDGGRDVAQAEGRAGEALTLRIPEPRPWSPDDPHLYDLEVTLGEKRQRLDRVDSYFGLRTIEIGQDEQGILRLLLNGKPLFQYGPLDQGWWPDGLHTPPTDEAMVYDIQATKAFGMNMARKHVKVECARWYYWCDKLGLLVWQDMPAGDSGRNDESKVNFRQELRAMMEALSNHPSIVMWVPFNEGWGQHDTEDIVAWTRKLDPTRPVNEASGWHNRGSGDISDSHQYPGPGMRPVEAQRTVVLGEFGGLGMPVSGHTWQDEANWGYVSYDTAGALTDAYIALLTALRPLVGQGLAAAVYTQTSDVEIEVNGLLTYDRKVVKMDREACAAVTRKLYGPPPVVTPLVPSSREEAQTWRYTTTPPEKGWHLPAFDDGAWETGPAGFGTDGTPGARVRTVWNGDTIWLRRSFQLESLPGGRGDLHLQIHHDEDASVYLNGVLISELSGYTTGYSLTPLGPESLRALRVGENTLAVFCRQTSGGQYIDAGLTLLQERGP